MNRNEQLVFCKKCANKAFDFKRGILCKLSNDYPDFDIKCKDYEEVENVSTKPKNFTDPQPRIIAGEKLICHVCKKDVFWVRNSLMETKMQAFLHTEMFASPATNYICDNCGYVMWFFVK